VVGDRQNPRLELALVTVELRELANDLQEDLSQQVVRLAHPP
jgi:hypothetical protein